MTINCDMNICIYNIGGNCFSPTVDMAQGICISYTETDSTGEIVAVPDSSDDFVPSFYNREI